MLAVCLLPIYGCGGPDAGGNNIPMGRYVEDILEPPGGVTGIISHNIDKDGSVNIYTYDGESISKYKTTNGESWQKQDVEWKLPEGQMFTNMAHNGAGEIFVATREMRAVRRRRRAFRFRAKCGYGKGRGNRSRSSNRRFSLFK
jgi:hypothetical protein